MRVKIHTSERGKSLAESRIKFIGWQNSSDRKWLLNHLHWAMHNNHSVIVIPVSESN